MEPGWSDTVCLGNSAQLSGGSETAQASQLASSSRPGLTPPPPRPPDLDRHPQDQAQDLHLLLRGGAHLGGALERGRAVAAAEVIGGRSALRACNLTALRLSERDND